MKVFELVIKTTKTRVGLYATREEADKWCGLQNRHLYEIKPVYLNVIFILALEDGGGPYRAFSTLEKAKAFQKFDDEIIVWELE